ncbi:siderophore-interacting protein [Subtercola sp. RTI3]|uniref:siderophore-interacting protein n=1 Tax=Subtercola sp. RTI3 TaxID=3048639 RepID=UPI002B221E5B|nr:siderophore-interacting protein [Subtercola sp. RTI3]MEA9986930.1 siderophore-interacting protein [Subtercola sp. RTI3]
MNETDLNTNTSRTVNRVRYEPRSRSLTVIRVEPLSPTMVRIALSGTDLESDFPIHPLAAADHVKLVFPDPTSGLLTLPAPGQLRSLRPNGEPWITRDYTIRAFDHERRELSIDFVLHDHGPAGRWARDARVGSSLGVLGPRGSRVYPTQYSHYLLVADETGVPALERFIEELPHSINISALIQVGTTEEERVLERTGLKIVWLHGGCGDNTRAMEASIREVIDTVGDDVFVWAAGEAGALKPVRSLLLDELGLDREQVDLHGYWRVGAAGNIGHKALEQ